MPVQAGLSRLQPYLKKIEAIKTLADLQAYLEEATPLGENPVCGWGVYADMKDSNQNAVYLSNFGLGLGRDYYQKTKRKQYGSHRQISDLCCRYLQAPWRCCR